MNSLHLILKAGRGSGTFRLHLILLALFLGTPVWWCSAQPVIITEFLAANDANLADDDGDYSDWIELYNPGETSVNLGGWFLTDAQDNRTKWRFPARTLASKSFLIVFASGKNRAGATGVLHTSFKLDLAGEYLALVQPDGLTLATEFSPAYPPQNADISYGFRMEGQTVSSGNPVFLAPTPGEANGNVAATMAPPVQFSRAGGTFVDPFNLTLSTPSLTAKIHYVLVRTKEDASAAVTNVPGVYSPLYSGAIPITQTTEVRVRAFEPGKLPGPPATVSFIQIDGGVAKFSSGLPVVMVHNFGAGRLPLNGNQGGLLASFEPGFGQVSLTDGPTLMSRVGLTEKGSATAGAPKQGMNVEFWDEYNQDIDYAFLGMPPESDWVFHSLGGFDPSLMHNAVFHELGRRTGRYSSRTRYVEVFRKTDLGPVTMSDYFGLFLVLERPRVGPDRVAIHKLEPSDSTGEAVTGGYLVRIDRVDANERSFMVPFATTSSPISNRYGGQVIVLDNPKGPDLYTDPRRAPQLAYIRSYFTNFLNALTAPDWLDPQRGYAAFIDVDSWIDNHIVNTLCFNVDSYRINAYLVKDRSSKLEQGPWWDCDRGLGTGGAGSPPAAGTPQSDNRAFNPRVWRLPATDVGSDQGTDFFGLSLVGLNWFDRLFRDPDFWQRWIDRYQTLRAGSFANGAVQTMVDGFAREITEAQAREQARWAATFTFPRWGSQSAAGYSNDFGPANPAYSRGGYFSNEVTFLKRWLSDRFDFIDTNFLARPAVSQPPGQVTPGTTLYVMAAPKPGTLLLYTLDGTDPRLPGGVISPLAKTNAGALQLTLNSNVRLFARSYNTNHYNLTQTLPNLGGLRIGNPPSNSFWSGPIIANYYTAVPNVRLTEVNYHPPSSPANAVNGAEALEFVEVKNAGSQVVDLGGASFQAGISFTFPLGFTLQPGQHTVIVHNRAAFVARYGSDLLIAGEFSGNLADSGERLKLVGAVNEPIFDVAYDPAQARITDGHDFSLVAINESGPDPVSWRASAARGGSPGQTDPAPPVIPAVVINEVLSHAPVADDNAIELLNLAATPADLSGWYLTDDFVNPRKYRIPQGTILAPGAFATIKQSAFRGSGDPANPGFVLRSSGGAVYLFSADATAGLTGYLHGLSFGPLAAGVTVGRYVISTGQEQFVPQSSPSLQASNAGPVPAALVISEIHYLPSSTYQLGRCATDNGQEFIEVYNPGTQPILLQPATEGTGGWRLQGDVTFTFPPGSLLGPGRYVVVVPFDPVTSPDRLTAWRALFGVPQSVTVFGPWIGTLPDSQGKVELAQSVELDPGVPSAYSALETVGYSAMAPWPAAGTGFGLSLQRLAGAEFGNDPAQWTTAPPSPGRGVTLGQPPVIVVEPADAAVPASGRVVFTGAASGPEPIRYAWRFNGCQLPGATESSLTLSNIQPDQAGVYELMAFNASGGAFSRPATLTVLTPARILQAPQSQRAREGTTVSFSIVATTGNPPLAYQWLKNGLLIAGQTNQVLRITNITEANDGDYSVALTDGNGTTYSPSASLIVLIPPSMIEPVTPLHLTAVEGGTVTFSARTRGARPMLYRWRQITPTSGTVRTNMVLNSHLGFFTIANVRPSDAGIYTLILTNEVVTIGNVQQTNATLTVLSDADHDGLPDNWESEFFGSATGAIGDEDPDGDGQNNRSEYIAGTNPKNAASYLKVDRVTISGSVRLEFLAIANHTYTIQYKDDLESPAWLRFTDVVASQADKVTEIIDSPPSDLVGKRFYRLATPRVGE